MVIKAHPNLLLFLLLSTFIIFVNSSDLSAYPTIKLEIQKDFMTGRICAGTPPQCFDATIDINSIYTWFPANRLKTRSPVLFYPKQSSTYFSTGLEKYIVYPQGELISGILSTDVFASPKTPMSFIVGDMCEDYLWYEGLLALGFQCEKGSFTSSYIEQLYQSHYISQRVFNIKYEKDTYAQLTFGVIPQELIDNKQYYGNCPAIVQDRFNPKELNPGWHCYIKGFFFGPKYIKDKVHPFANDLRVIFDINKMVTIVPMSFLLYLEKYYFTKLISEGKCRFGLKKELYTVTCVKNKYQLSKINLLFGDWAIQLGEEDFFQYDERDKEYDFILRGQLANNLFTFGDTLLRKFTMVFDKDNKKIGFYSKTNVIKATASAIDSTDLEFLAN